MKKINIIFNTDYPLQSNLEWKVFIDGIENLVNEFMCETPTYSSSEFIEGSGMRWHISTFANEFEINKTNNKTNNKIIIIIK
jgi:hypothetical protein